MKGISNITTALVLSLFLSSCGIMSYALIGGGATYYVVKQNKSAGEIIDDSLIKTRIFSKLLQLYPKDALYSVATNVNKGEVYLTGVLKSEEHKAIIENIVREDASISHIINEIQIDKKYTIAQRAKDKAIYTEISIAFLVSQNIISLNYKFDVVNGILYLFGNAKNDIDLYDATNIASKIKGVKKVESYVKLNTNA